MNITTELFIFEFKSFDFILYIKLQLKLTIFIFWAKLTQKWCFQPKTDETNNSIELCIFEIVQAKFP